MSYNHEVGLAATRVGLASNHPRLAVRLYNLAGYLYDGKRFAEAEPLDRRALAIDEASYGPDNPNVANDLWNLAELLFVAWSVASRRDSFNNSKLHLMECAFAFSNTQAMVVWAQMGFRDRRRRWLDQSGWRPRLPERFLVQLPNRREFSVHGDRQGRLFLSGPGPVVCQGRFGDTPKKPVCLAGLEHGANPNREFALAWPARRATTPNRRDPINAAAAWAERQVRPYHCSDHCSEPSNRSMANSVEF